MSGIKKWVAGGVIVAAIGGGVWAWTHRAKEPSTADKYITAKASLGDVRALVTATGVIEPWKIVDVKSDVAGKIIHLYKDLGNRVKKGELVADIDQTDTIAAKELAVGSRDSDTAKRNQASTSVVQQRLATQSQVAAALQALNAAEAKELQAGASAKAQPALTKSAIAQADAALSAANRTLTQSQQAKQELESQLSTLNDVTIPLNIQTVDATLSQARANVVTTLADYNRKRNLLGQGYVAKADVEASYSSWSTAKSAVDTILQRRKTLDRENVLVIQDLKDKISESQSQIDTETAHVAAAQATLESAKENAVQDQIAMENWDAAKAAVKQAKADLDSARATYPLINERKQDVKAYSASLFSDAANLRQAETNLRYTHVLSPRDGVIVTKSVEEGTVVPSSKSSVGTTGALVQVGDDSIMWCVCQVDETDIAQVHKGQKVAVRMDAYPDTPVPGFVYRIDPSAIVTNSVTTVPVTVQVNHPDPRMRNQMNATCDFFVGQAKDVVTVPNDAVKGSGTHTYVQVLKNGQPKPLRVPVKIGLVGSDLSQIKSGLSEGDVVVLREKLPPQGAPGTNNPLGGFGPGRGGGGRGR